MPQKAEGKSTVNGRYSGSKLSQGPLTSTVMGEKKQGGAENRGKRGCVTEINPSKKDVRG